MSDSAHSVSLRQRQDFQFDVAFDDAAPALQSDLPPPLGGGQGPTPEHFLAAAVGNCLSASLLFTLRKLKVAVEPIATVARAEVGRNAENRLRVLSMEVRITLGAAAAGVEHLQRAVDSFEAYCTVTQSVRAGIPVNLQVVDSTGVRLK